MKLAGRTKHIHICLTWKKALHYGGMWWNMKIDEVIFKADPWFVSLSVFKAVIRYRLCSKFRSKITHIIESAEQTPLCTKGASFYWGISVSANAQNLKLIVLAYDTQGRISQFIVTLRLITVYFWMPDAKWQFWYFYPSYSPRRALCRKNYDVPFV